MPLFPPLARQLLFVLSGARRSRLTPARAGDDIYVRAGPNFTPVSIAVTPLSGDTPGGQDRRDRRQRPRPFRFLAAAQPDEFSRKHRQSRRGPKPRCLEDRERAICSHRPRDPRGGHGRAVPPLGHPPTGEQVAGQQYTSDGPNTRRIAHLIADAVFSRITGEKGFFDSRVVFVDETGSKEKRRKRLALMDMDGANVEYLTNGDKLVVTPRFSPSAQQVAYMSFGEADPKVTLLDLETGQREDVGNFEGMTFSPRFSPDGQRVIMSLSDGSTSNLYTMDLAYAGENATHRHQRHRYFAVVFA